LWFLDKKKPDPRPMGSTMAARKAEKRRERAQKRKQVHPSHSYES